MRMAQADRFMAVAFFALGIATLVGGWTMDRLEIRRIHPASLPGLVPIILGVLLALCAVLLWWQSREQHERNDAPFLQGGSWSRLGMTALLCVIYALVLVGWLPFFWATTVFVAAFTGIFSWPVDAAVPKKLLTLALVLGFGVLAASLTSLLFEKLFLVRLP